MDSNQIHFISPSVCESFISKLCETQKKRDLSPKEKRAIQAILVLSEFMETGLIQRKNKFKFLEGNIGGVIQKYILLKQDKRLRSLTIAQIERNLGKFNFWLSANDISDISNVRQHHVIGFIQGLDPKKSAYIHNTLMDLRSFFRYLYHEDIISTNFAASIPKDNYRSLSKLPSNYSEDEIIQVLECIDKGTILGKRDNAIFMLAIRLGMRASDIANLKFENLHWDKNTIIFQQRKGGRETILPLLPAIGNSLLDYIQYGRPKSNEPYVFLNARSPYPPVKTSTIGGLVTRRFRNANLNLKNRKLESHVLRHSLVKELLQNKQSLSVITNVLGHKNQESTKHYIRIDLEALRKCALDIPPVDAKFYSQGNDLLFN